jgi:hypothetical protein
LGVKGSQFLESRVAESDWAASEAGEVFCLKPRRSAGKLDSFARTVRHSKARAEVLGKQADSGAIVFRIVLGKILHRFYQQSLAFNETGIGGAFLGPAAGGIRQYRNGEDLRHTVPLNQHNKEWDAKFPRNVQS